MASNRVVDVIRGRASSSGKLEVLSLLHGRVHQRFRRATRARFATSASRSLQMS